MNEGDVSQNRSGENIAENREAKIGVSDMELLQCANPSQYHFSLALEASNLYR
jgi:hypothetical protein